MQTFTGTTGPNGSLAAAKSKRGFLMCKSPGPASCSFIEKENGVNFVACQKRSFVTRSQLAAFFCLEGEKPCQARYG